MITVFFAVIEMVIAFAEAEEDAAFVNSYSPPQRPYQRKSGQM